MLFECISNLQFYAKKSLLLEVQQSWGRFLKDLRKLSKLSFEGFSKELSPFVSSLKVYEEDDQIVADPVYVSYLQNLKDELCCVELKSLYTELKNYFSSSAAIKVQTVFRGFLERKKYYIAPAEIYDLTTAKAFAVGNDPYITIENKEEYKATKPAVLVGLSGLRAVLLAYQLSEISHMPFRVVIVDNSEEVYQFWIKIRAFFQHPEADSRRQFIRLQEIIELHSSTDAGTFFSFLRTLLFSEDKTFLLPVLQLLKNTVILKQSWTNNDVFRKLRHIFDLADYDVFLYASNVLSCAHPIDVSAILKSIEILNPRLGIYTDLDEKNRNPINFYLLTSHSPRVISTTLGLNRVLTFPGHKTRSSPEFHIK